MSVPGSIIIVISFSVIFSAALTVFEVKLQEKLLLCSRKMERGHFFQEPVIMIDMMLESEPEIFKKFYGNRGF